MVRRACILLLLIVPTAALHPECSDGLDDVSSAIQRSVDAHPSSKLCTPKTPAFLRDAAKLKKVLDESTAVIKLASTILSNQHHTRISAQQQSETAKKREGATRTALREQIRAFLKSFHAIPSDARGILTGWAMPQIMELRRSSQPDVQDLIDEIVAMDVMDMNANNIESKVTELAKRFQQSGQEGLAKNISGAAPLAKKVALATEELLLALRGKGRAADLLHTIANLSNTFTMKRPVADFISDLAGILDERPVDLKGQLSQRVLRLFKDLNVSVNARLVPTISEMAVELPSQLRRGGLKSKDIVPHLSRLLGETEFGKKVNALPVILNYLSEISSINAGEVDRARVILTVARFLNDMKVFDKVGGALGAFTVLLTDLAKFYEAHDSNPRHIIPRFARLANELHVFNSTTRRTMAIAFNHVAEFACELSDVHDRASICRKLDPQKPLQGNSSVPATSFLELNTVGGLEYDGEVAGEAMGALFEALASPRSSSSMALIQEGINVRPARDPCDVLDPMQGKVGDMIQKVAQLVDSAKDSSKDQKGMAGKKRTQSAEAKHKEPATRAALRGQVTALLGRVKALPSMARGLIAGYIVPKIMEMRRNSGASVQAAIDTLVAVDIPQSAEAMDEVFRSFSSGRPREAKTPAHAGKLLRKAAGFLQKAGAKPPVTEFMLELATRMEDGSKDSLLGIPNRTAQLLTELGARAGATTILADITTDLVASFSENRSADVLPKVAQFINEMNVLTPTTRERVALAIEDMALFMCSLRSMQSYMPLCASVAVPPEARAAAEEEDKAPATPLLKREGVSPMAAALSDEAPATSMLTADGESAPTASFSVQVLHRERPNFKRRESAPAPAPAKPQATWHRKLHAAPERPRHPSLLALSTATRAALADSPAQEYGALRVAEAMGELLHAMAAARSGLHRE